MIDLKLELQDYRSIDLQAIAGSDAEISDSTRNSVVLYNKAIESIKSGSEDIAVIELKKAVALNPNFHEAMNLLGLCYMNTKDYDKAAELFDRVIKAEHNSIIAMNYMNQLNPSSDRKQTDKGRAGKKQKDAGQNGKISQENNPQDYLQTEKLRKEKLQIEKLQKDKSRNDNNPFTRSRPAGISGAGGSNIGMYFTVGILCLAVGVILTLLIKSGSKGNTDVMTDYQTAADAKVAAAEQGLADSQAKYEELVKEDTALKSSLKAALEEIEHYKALQKLNDAEGLSTARKYDEAADMLLLMKTTSFTKEELAAYEALKAKVLPSAAWMVFESGYKLYNNKKYAEALDKLGKVPVYSSSFERMDAVYYYLGRCSQQLNDSRNALAYFQKVIDNYPKSSYAINAKQKMRSITAQP